MEKECCISIIIPIYNVDKYLNQCLDSVCCQASDNIEVILVDDGSTDYSGTICNEYVYKYNNVKVIHKENGGLVSARKSGVKAARGKYITFVDGDDWIDEDWYERAERMIENNNIDILVYGYREEYFGYSKRVLNNKMPGKYVGNSLDDIKESSIVNKKEYVFWEISPHVWNKIVRKEIMEKCIQNVDECVTFGEDAACIYPCIWKSESILITEDTPYHYRQRVDSMSKFHFEIENNSFESIKKCLVLAANSNKKILEQIDLYILYIYMLRKYSQLSKYNMTLFPFEEVKKQNKIVIYCAGDFGKSLWKYIKNTKCAQVVGIIDKKGCECSEEDFLVQDVNEIKNMEYDYIIVSILNEKVAHDIFIKLVEMGIDKEKVLYVKIDTLRKMKGVIF